MSQNQQHGPPHLQQPHQQHQQQQGPQQHQPPHLQQPHQQQQGPQQHQQQQGPQQPPVRICCIGAGRLGVMSMLVMARQCPNTIITIVDTDGAKIQAWNSNFNIINPQDLRFPIYEPELQQLYLEVRQTQRLSFSDQVGNFVNLSELIFIAVEIPLEKPFVKKGKKDMGEWDRICRMIRDAPGLLDKTVVTISTVPPYFKDMLRHIFTVNLSRRFLYSPCFMREGTAIHDLQHPFQVIIAYELHGNPVPPNVLLDFVGITVLRNLYLQWIPPVDIRIVDGFEKASLIKLFVNSTLATRIATINSYSEVCHQWGVNFNEISDLIGASHPDLRHDLFNPQPGVGFGGVGLVEDLSHLSLVSTSNDMSGFYKSVLKVNDLMQKNFVKLVLDKLNSFKGKRFAILGFTHKVNTESVRNSPAIQICKSILKIGGETARLKIFDPKAKRNDIIFSFGKFERGRVDVMETAFEACYQVDAILILTEWPEFLQLDYTHIGDILMNQHSSKDIFVGRSIENFPNLGLLGFRVHYIERQ